MICEFENTYCLCQYCTACEEDDKRCIKCYDKGKIMHSKYICFEFEGGMPVPVGMKIFSIMLPQEEKERFIDYLEEFYSES